MRDEDDSTWHDGGRLVDIGGRWLALRVAGQGEPAVVLEMGLGAGAAFFDEIARRVAAHTRVVWYDRAGLGQSDRAPTPRSVADLAGDLHALLGAAAIRGPYVLVGHSLGGLTVRYYQHQYLPEVAALVLVDSAHEDQRERLLDALPHADLDEPEAVARARHGLLVTWGDPGANDEGINNVANTALMRVCGDLGSLPLVVIGRGRPAATPDGFPPELIERREEAWRQMRRELAGLSSRSVHLVAERAGHVVNQDQPEIVVEGIRRALALVRGQAE